MSSKHYKVTARELLALVATAETCLGMSEGLLDEGLRKEATDAMNAIKRIEKRNGISIQSEFSDCEEPSAVMIEWDR